MAQAGRFKYREVKAGLDLLVRHGAIVSWTLISQREQNSSPLYEVTVWPDRPPERMCPRETVGFINGMVVAHKRSRSETTESADEGQKTAPIFG